MNLKTWFNRRLRETQTAISKAKVSGTDAESIAAMEAFERFTQTFVANELWKPRERTEPEGNDSESEGHQWLREQETEALHEIDALLEIERQKGDDTSLRRLEFLRISVQSCFSHASVHLLSNAGTTLDPKVGAAVFEAGTHYQDARFGLMIWSGQERKRDQARKQVEQLKIRNRKPKPTRDEVEDALRIVHESRPYARNKYAILREAGQLLSPTIGVNWLRDLIDEYGLSAKEEK